MRKKIENEQRNKLAVIVASISLCPSCMNSHFDMFVISETQLWIHMSLFLLLLPYCYLPFGSVWDWKCASQFKTFFLRWLLLQYQTITQWRNNLKSFLSIPSRSLDFSVLSRLFLCYLVMQSATRRRQKKIIWSGRRDAVASSPMSF